MDLVEDNALPADLTEEAFRIIQCSSRPRKLAVEVLDVRHRTAEDRLARSAHALEPDHRSLLPRRLDSLKPRPPQAHMPALWHIALPDTKLAAPRIAYAPCITGDSRTELPLAALPS